MRIYLKKILPNFIPIRFEMMQLQAFLKKSPPTTATTTTTTRRWVLIWGQFLIQKTTVCWIT